MTDCDILITGAGQLVCVRSDVSRQPSRGRDLSSLHIISDGAIAFNGGAIVWVGSSRDVPSNLKLAPGGQEYNARGAVLTPGLIDAHTHPVFAAPRQVEFAMRAAGKSYQQIAAEGGGIANSVAKTRSATEDSLFENALKVAGRMLGFGTTTSEAKSGYGLSLDDELKLLRVIRRVNHAQPMDWVPTALPAHEVPVEYRSNPNAYVELICNEILPAIVTQKLAVFNDVFFESGVFDREQSFRIQTRAAELGLGLKFHVDELSDVNGAGLAASMNAVSADHLVYVSGGGIDALAHSATIAVMLPGTAYTLDLPRKPPVRQMIEAGVAIALATDCNPGSNMTESMQMAMNQAVVLYKMTPEEAIVAATHNAACALGCSERVGSLVPGLRGDVVIWDAEDYRELPYHYGVNLARTVIKDGKVAAGRL